MHSLTLRHDVALVFIVTEELKTSLLLEIDTTAEEVQRQIEQFDFRARQALAEQQRADLNRAMVMRQQIEAEKRKMEAVKTELVERRKEVEALEIGAEYQRGGIEGQVEIKVGDNLFEKLAGIQVLVKDSKVIEIRQLTMNPGEIILPMVKNAHSRE